jgi:hypothetical protein
MTKILSGRWPWLGVTAGLCLVGLTGCEPKWASQNSRQGHELEKIAQEGRKLIPEAPAGLPVRFDPIAIDRKTNESGVYYRAALIWRLAGTRAEAEPLLRKLAAATQPGAAEREVLDVVLRLEYRDAGGQLCATETVILDMGASSGTIPLRALGQGGSPARVTATVESVRLRSPEDDPDDEGPPEQEVDPR